jgi:hypothetical protein
MLTDLYAYITAADTSTLDADRAAALTTIRGLIASGSPLISRLYPDIVDEGAQLPAMSYSVISNTAEHTLDGANDGLFSPRVQIDVFSTTSLQRGTLGDAVKVALDGYTQTAMGGTFVGVLIWDNEIDVFESERKQYRKTLDFKVVHN